MTWLRTIVWIAYAILWIGGVGAHLLYGATPPNTAWAAPAFLLIAAILVLLHTDIRRPLIAGALGFTAEAIGVRFGFPFGAYRYSNVLAPAWIGVPLGIGAAWMILVTYIRQRLGRTRAYVCLAAGFMVAIDLLIDPIAANLLHYWEWKTSGVYFGIPLSNFAGWLLVSLMIFTTQPPLAPNRGVRVLGVSVILFFTAIASIHHLWIPAFVGVSIVALDARVFRPLITRWRQHAGGTSSSIRRGPQ